MWSVTGGGIDLNETSLDAVIRECKEELGIKIDTNNLELMLSLKRRYDFTDIWFLKQDFKLQDLKLQEEEVSEVKWENIEKIKEMIERKNFAPNIEIYFDMVIKLIQEELNFKQE